MPTYVYAITSADHPMQLEGLSGVGNPPAPLRSFTAGPLAAVVSDAPAELRAKRRDLLAHQNVAERLMGDGAVLPMRFGLVAPDDAEVKNVLEQESEGYRERLAELDGCAEYNLKVSRVEDSMLREILSSSQQARELREYTQQHPEAQEQKMALGELIAREVQTREEAEAQEMASALASAAERVEHAEPTKAHFLNVSFLVKRDRAAALTQAVHEEAERRGDDYEFTLNGPLPPYSFV